MTSAVLPIPYTKRCILRKRSELNAYCCTPKAFIYKILNKVGLCSPANNFHERKSHYATLELY